MGRRGHPWESATTATAALGQLVGSPESAQGEPGFEPGTRVGRYEVVKLVGEGGMGMVYRARDTELAREVALKRIDPGRLGLDESRARLRREAQAMARVDHPSVVRIYDVGVDGGHLFVAMELVAGGTLTEWLKQRPRSWREILDVLLAAGRGIAAAHRAGLVHRDIKPGNILVDDRGTAKVTDFGLARTPDDKDRCAPPSEAELLSGNITRTGVVAGTPAYMSPEQIAGEPVDARADQFSFCVALWEALCGSRPFRLQEEPTSVQKALLRAITDGEVTQPNDDVKVPRRILAAVRRGLSGDPALRWPSMDALLAALERDVRPYRGVVMPGLLGIAVAGSAVGAFFAIDRAERSEPILLVERAITINQTNEEQKTIVLLRDGRYLKMERSELMVSDAEPTPRKLPMPAGQRPVVARSAGCSGSALVYTNGETCRWWRVPLSGNPWQPLADDAACGRLVEVDVSPDGKQVAIASERGIVIRDLASGAERTVISTPIIASELTWSPDGRRLALEIDARMVVVDASTGARQDFGGFGQEPTWLDSHRIFYVAAAGWNLSEIRLRDLRTGEVTVAGILEGQIADLSLGPNGLLALAQSSFPRVYVAKTGADRPLSVGELTSVYTGASLDFEPLTWTSAGTLVSSAVVDEQRSLVETVLEPMQRGVPIVQRRVEGMFHAGTSMDNIIFGLGNNRKFTLYAFDVATRKERVWKEVEYDGIPQLECARQAPRCRLRGSPDRWFDPLTLTVGAPAPRIDPDERLSPDGGETARVRGTSVVIRALDGDTEKVIAPEPAIEGPIRVIWGGDSRTLLIFASRSEQNLRQTGYHRLLRLERDGSWRTIIHDPVYIITRALGSPDGSQLAFTAQRPDSKWRLVPFAPRMQKTVVAALAEAYAAAHRQP